MGAKNRNERPAGAAARVVKQARRLATRVQSWADFSNAMFDPEHGLVSQTFPNEADQKAFLASPEYREIRGIHRQLMDRFGVADGATPKKSGKFVVRLPKTLHFALKREAAHEGVSLNQLVVAKLALSLGGIAQQRGA